MSTFPLEFTHFLETYIHSTSELSILLQLARNTRREWTPIETALAVRCDLDRAAQALEALVERGFASRAGVLPSTQYLYAPRSPDLGSLVAMLDRAEREQPVSLIRAIYRLPVESDRTPPVPNATGRE